MWKKSSNPTVISKVHLEYRYVSPAYMLRMCRKRMVFFNAPYCTSKIHRRLLLTIT